MSNQIYRNQLEKYVGHGNFPICALHLFNNQAINTASALNPIIFDIQDVNNIAYCVPDLTTGIISMGAGKYLVEYELPINPGAGLTAPGNQSTMGLYVESPNIILPYTYQNILASSSIPHVENQIMSHTASWIIDITDVFELTCLATSFSSVTQSALGSFTGVQYSKLMITQLEAYV